MPPKWTFVSPVRHEPFLRNILSVVVFFLFRNGDMKKPHRDAATHIRQVIATDYNVAFLRSLPLLRVRPKLPKNIRVLLERLHDVENAGK